MNASIPGRFNGSPDVDMLVDDANAKGEIVWSAQDGYATGGARQTRV
ncbi:MAG: hypothetical protein AAGI11_13710 [Pseudomonadota bacterium]